MASCAPQPSEAHQSPNCVVIEPGRIKTVKSPRVWPPMEDLTCQSFQPERVGGIGRSLRSVQAVPELPHKVIFVLRVPCRFGALRVLRRLGRDQMTVESGELRIPKHISNVGWHASVAVAKSEPKVSVELVGAKLADSLHNNPTCIGLRQLFKACCNLRVAAHYDTNPPFFEWLEDQRISHRDVFNPIQADREPRVSTCRTKQVTQVLCDVGERLCSIVAECTLPNIRSRYPQIACDVAGRLKQGDCGRLSYVCRSIQPP